VKERHHNSETQKVLSEGKKSSNEANLGEKDEKEGRRTRETGKKEEKNQT